MEDSFVLMVLPRILMALFSGALIGFERENRNKFAGVRTHIIVALGACVGMIVSKYGFEDSIKFDASRVAAQIISGIGFLGAGVIFVKNDHVSGLTTAAGIWTTSIIGMAYGAGLYIIGILSVFLVVLIQFVLYRNEYFTFGYSLYTLRITTKDPYLLDELEEYLKTHNISQRGIELNYLQNVLHIDIKYLCRNVEERNQLIKYLSRLDRIETFKII